MSELEQVFHRLYRAKRDAALTAERVRRLEMDLETARNELERAREIESEYQAKLDRMASEAAGIIQIDDTPDERPVGYAPIG